ncbi:CpXC domain-containing protein [Facklamia lactis]|uniref:CpXC domain-containing protein n=1 Tax=Facklamia lactis TaxID=2749967 RepID=UPI0018CFD4F4|nr:CpXC domain-containing protein [Facklamia lactis]MBG9980579.1 CpXC domain-containing protein [Facklamia lactis]
MPQTIHVQCPICQTKSSRLIETAINAQLHPELKQELLNGSLLGFKCEHCGANRQIETQIMYHDPEKKLLIYVAPNFNENRDQIVNGLEQILKEEEIDASDYHLRITTSVPQLVEKIQISDVGMDDQTIEVVKLLTDGLFAQQEPDRKVINRYFMIKDDEPKFLYLTEDEQLLVDYHPTLSEFVLDKFGKELNKQHLGRFLIVDQQWATNIANNLPGTGPLKTESE